MHPPCFKIRTANQVGQVLTSPSHRPTLFTLDKEHGPGITMDHMKGLTQGLIRAAESSVGSLYQQFAVTERETVPYYEAQLLVAIEKLMAAEGVPSNVSNPEMKPRDGTPAPAPNEDLAEQPAMDVDGTPAFRFRPSDGDLRDISAFGGHRW